MRRVSWSSVLALQRESMALTSLTTCPAAAVTRVRLQPQSCHLSQVAAVASSHSHTASLPSNNTIYLNQQHRSYSRYYYGYNDELTPEEQQQQLHKRIKFLALGLRSMFFLNLVMIGVVLGIFAQLDQLEVRLTAVEGVVRIEDAKPEAIVIEEDEGEPSTGGGVMEEKNRKKKGGGILEND